MRVIEFSRDNFDDDGEDDDDFDDDGEEESGPGDLD